MTAPSHEAAPTAFGRIVKRALRPALFIVPPLLVIGVALGFIVPVTYTAETRMAVGTSDLSAAAVPGYVAGLVTLATNYARYVETTSQDVDSISHTLGVPATSITSIVATPIPDSNIIRIQVSATSAKTARDAATAVGEELRTEVGRAGNSQSDLLNQLQGVSQQLAQAQQVAAAAQQRLNALDAQAASSTAVAQAQADLVTKQAQVSVLDAKRAALASTYQDSVQSAASAVGLTTVRTSAVTGTSRSSLIQWYVFLGLIVGILLSLLVGLLGDRKTVRGARAGEAFSTVDPDRVGDLTDARPDRANEASSPSAIH